MKLLSPDNALSRFGINGIIRSLKFKGFARTFKMIIFEVTKPLAIPMLNFLFTIDSKLIKADTPINLGRSIIFPGTGLILSQKFGFVPSISPSHSRIGYLLWKSLFEIKLINILLNPYQIFNKHKKYVACVSNPHKSNYYHFLLDSLGTLNDSLDQFELYITKEQFNYYDSFRSLVGPKLPLLNVTESQIMHVSDAILIPYRPLKDRVDYLNEIVDNDRKNPRHGLFIKRNNSIERRIYNRNELFDHLKNMGVVDINPTRGAQDIEMFEHAKYVIGAHGAGLVGVIFCSEPVLIEIVGGRYDDTYKNLIKVKKGHYHRVWAKKYGADLIVGSEQVQEIVDIVNGYN